MEHHKLQIEGMTCKACGAIIKSNIQALPDVSCVDTDWQNGTVEFVIPDATTEITVEREIESLGYVVTEHIPVENPQDGQAPV